MVDENTLKKVIINYLHYVNKVSVEEATTTYQNSRREIEIVANILGEDFVVGLLEAVVVKQTSINKANKGKGK